MSPTAWITAPISLRTQTVSTVRLSCFKSLGIPILRSSLRFHQENKHAPQLPWKPSYDILGGIASAVWLLFYTTIRQSRRRKATPVFPNHSLEQLGTNCNTLTSTQIGNLPPRTQEDNKSLWKQPDSQQPQIVFQRIKRGWGTVWNCWSGGKNPTNWEKNSLWN